MKGFFNKILRIHLKAKTFQEEILPDSILETHLGGKGVGTYLLMRDNPPGVDPLAPENKLIFCTGPITHTRIYGSCRHGVFTKSPLTGIYSESYSGGRVAEPMSRTGYDAFIIEEASAEPVWIEVYLREGLTPREDTLPERFFDEPLGKDRKTIRREELHKMLQDYYALRGWSSEGIPKPKA